jgi:hypothetical protein
MDGIAADVSKTYTASIFRIEDFYMNHRLLVKTNSPIDEETHGGRAS